MKFLFAAYAATWAIHIFYLVTLTRGYRKVQAELEELERDANR